MTTAAARAPAAGTAGTTHDARIARTTLPDARHDRLYFAQVREDPELELAALRPALGGHVVVVASGGCTALSLLAAGAGRVTAVDLNATQNHLVELKAQAVAVLGGPAATAFLGGAPDPLRLERWAQLRDRLGPAARRWWSSRPAALRRGVLRGGVSERFIAVVVAAMRLGVHPPARVRRLLACRTLEEQRALYAREWNSRRWRLLFALLLNRWTFDRAYHPAFFASVRRPSFAAYFHDAVGRGLTELPVATNYFLHQMLTGHYPAGGDAALPPYLTAAGAAAVGRRLDALALVDGGLTSWLRTQPAGSVHGFALSNIGEWMTDAERDALFAEVARTAAPGARLVFRNFVGWTEVPARWREHVVEDRALGDALSARDRSLLQRRIVVCTVAPAPAVRVREATAADDAALVALAAACPMHGSVGLSVDRAPEFLALNRLEGERWRVGVVDAPAGGAPAGAVIGCVAAAERLAYLNGEARPVCYVGDLKVHPAHRGGPAADALEEWARATCQAWGGPDAPVFLTILAGNRAMERRAPGQRGLPRLARVGTIRSHSIPLLRRPRAAVPGVRVAPATAHDVDEMLALWARVARGRQFAPVLDRARFQRWLAAAPSLALDDYLVARGRDGRIAGFLGVWDQRPFKRLRVTGWSPRLRVVRAAVNLLAPLAGATPLPRAGQPLPMRTVVHPCVPGDRPAVLHALLRHACADLHGRDAALLSLALDVRDPLAVALRGLGAQPTDVHLYVTGGSGRWTGPLPDGRPLHFETALV